MLIICKKTANLGAMILFNRVAILGAGLLGSSLALAMKERGLCKSVAVWSRSQATRDKCKSKTWCDEVFDEVKGAVENADLIVLASTPSSISAVAKMAAPFVKKDAIITDLGSVKTEIYNSCSKIFGNGNFVASHPMAGSDKSGVDFADKDLFEKACVFVCDSCEKSSVQKIVKLWEALNMRVQFTSPENHDEIAANISHIPQAVATSLAMFAESKGCDIFKKFAGNGFRDTTRIAKSDANMWVDIFTQNSKNVAKGLREFIEYAQSLACAIEEKDEGKIRDIMQKAKEARLKMEK